MNNYDKKINSDFKKNVLNFLKEPIDKFKLKNECSKIFDPRNIIAYELLSKIATDRFVCGNNDLGYNLYRINKHFYEKFFEDLNTKNFKDKICYLLNKSKTKTPQPSTNRKLPFRQITRDGHMPALVGKNVEYSSKNDFDGDGYGRKKETGPYNYNFCNKTDIVFFKGPKDEAKIINKLKYNKLFSYCFLYGYVESALGIIFRKGSLNDEDDEHNFENPKYFYYDEKNSNIKNKIDQLRIDIFGNFFKLDKKDSIGIINEIEKSIFESSLSHFLLAKKENYFTQTSGDDQIYENLVKQGYLDQVDSVDNFIISIKDKKINEYNKGYKFDRINKIFNKSRKEKYEVSKYFDYYGIIPNYEQFRFYTLRCLGLTPYDVIKIKLNEKDIFIRYAINHGKNEFNYFTISKIFGC